jgi:hypothetical protein
VPDNRLMYNVTLIDQVCMTDFEDKRALLAEPLPSDIIVKILLKKIRSVTPKAILLQCSSYSGQHSFRFAMHTHVHFQREQFGCAG